MKAALLMLTFALMTTGLRQRAVSLRSCSSLHHPCSTSEDLRRVQTKLLQKYAGKHPYTAVSFFSFTSSSINVDDESLQAVRLQLLSLNVRGTLTVGELERGYNGAFAVPTQHLAAMHECLSAALGSDVDLNVGATTDYAGSSTSHPFKKLIVKAKSSVLTDGREGVKVLDLSSCPTDELSPAEWHKEVAELTTNQGDKGSPPLLLDCRNQYESEMGTFAGATPLATEVFADSFDRLDALLDGVPRDRRVLTFCTGGIRCAKVNTYLRQHLGMTNTGRLKKGIIHYDRWLEDEREKEGEEEKEHKESLFVGHNFLFDRRRLSDQNKSGGEESSR